MMKPVHFRHILGVSALITILIIGGITRAQEPTNTTQTQSGESNKNSTELEELKKILEKAEIEKSIAEVQKEITKAEMEELKAKWAISETEGKKGTITLKDGAGYYAEILAYLALKDAAKVIADSTMDKLGQEELIILGNVDLTTEKSLWNLLNLKLDLAINIIEKAMGEYQDLAEADAGKPASFIGGLIATPKILGAITDIAAFFKTDYTMYGKTITLNEKALIASSANHISNQNAGLTILIPEYDLDSKFSLTVKIHKLNSLLRDLESVKKMRVVDPLNEKIAQHSTTLDTLRKKRDTIKKSLGKTSLKKEEKEKLTGKLENYDSQIYYLSQYKRTKETIITPLDKDINAARELVSMLITKTDSSASPLEYITTIDFIHQHPKAKILYLTITSQGGEVTTSESSLSRSRISYMGGVVVTYFLTDINGRYYHSGNVNKTQKRSFKRKKGIHKMDGN